LDKAEVRIHPEITEFDKDKVWKEASEIVGLFEKYEPGHEFKEKVFEQLAHRGDIANLNGKVCITDQCARRPECYDGPAPTYAPGRSYLNP
jgi:hypothetical protein